MRGAPLDPLFFEGSQSAVVFNHPHFGDARAARDGGVPEPQEREWNFCFRFIELLVNGTQSP